MLGSEKDQDNHELGTGQGSARKMPLPMTGFRMELGEHQPGKERKGQERGQGSKLEGTLRRRQGGHRQGSSVHGDGRSDCKVSSASDN